MSELIYIPKTEDNEGDFIPCLYLPYMSAGRGSNKLLLFFHGNAEDLGISYQMLDHMRSMLHVNILAMEYPSYGAYACPDGPSEKMILRDAETTYKYVLE